MTFGQMRERLYATTSKDVAGLLASADAASLETLVDIFTDDVHRARRLIDLITAELGRRDAAFQIQENALCPCGHVPSIHGPFGCKVHRCTCPRNSEHAAKVAMMEEAW